MIYVGSTLIILWGLAHLIPTKTLIEGFANLTSDNKKIFFVEWLAEGLSQCFIGIMVLIVSYVAGTDKTGCKLVYLLSSAMLFALSILSFATKGKSSLKALRVCPFIEFLAATLIALGIFI